MSGLELRVCGRSLSSKPLTCDGISQKVILSDFRPAQFGIDAAIFGVVRQKSR
jgi:hypothetical protein